MTPEQKAEVLRLIEAHERTLALCRASAETTRDLAWELKRGSQPPPDALARTIEAAAQVLAEVGQVEIAIAAMKAALW